jgi:hypothetical protein
MPTLLKGTASASTATVDDAAKIKNKLVLGPDDRSHDEFE